MNEWQASSGRQSLLAMAEDQAASEPLQVSRQPMHVAVTERVRTLIIEGKMRPGERINENDLAGSLGCSRTPLRDALKTLQSEGLIIIEPHKGTYVSLITAEETAELFEALAAIERVCCEITTLRITAEELARLTDLHDRMFKFHRLGMRREYCELNDHVHMAFVSLSENKTLADMHGRLVMAGKRVRLAARCLENGWDRSAAEHREILFAVDAKDAEKAGRLIYRHVQLTGEAICESLKDLTFEEQVPKRRRPYARRRGFID